MKDASPVSETSRTGAERPARRGARAIIDADAVVANWRTFQRMGEGAECGAVIKADAYGLGVEKIAPALARAGARVFFTATLGEALAVRAVLGDGVRLFVLNCADTEDWSAFPPEITPVLNTVGQILAWGARGAAGLHVDTGMNRLGLPLEEARAAAVSLPNPALLISHLACAGDPAHPLNARQLERFTALFPLFPHAPKSLSATAGAQLGAPYRFDVTRIGVGLYGAADRPDGVALATAARVEAPVLAVRQVAAGESIGYGAEFVATHPIKIATVALGYADGCLRSLAGRGYGVLGGVKAPILGRVSMDLIVLDVSACAPVRAGDWAQFLGPEAPLEDVAARAGTNSYEVLTTLVGGVRRGTRG